MLLAPLNDIKNGANKRFLNPFVKQIPHRADEDTARMFPVQWNFQAVRVNMDITKIITTPNYSVWPVNLRKPPDHPCRVAMFAPSRNGSASRNWIPRSVCPRYFRFIAHAFPLIFPARSCSFWNRSRYGIYVHSSGIDNWYR